MSSKKDKISKMLADSLSSANVRKEGAQVENVLGRFLETPIESKVSQTSQVIETSQVRKTRQASETRQVSDLSTDESQTSQAIQTRQVTQTDQRAAEVDLMASLPDVKGYLKLYFQLIDHLYPQLDPFERAVHETLYRLSWGFNKATCIISYQRLAERTNMSHKSAQRAAGKLEQKGLIGKVDRVVGYGKAQGIEFSVVPAPRQVLETRQASQTRQVLQTPITDNTFNSTLTQPGVRVSSRYSLEECRAYADHLKKSGQGITNPGGYATKIHRTGEADEMIAGWLSPQPALDVSQCPDCRGSGFVYIDPANADRGVKKCGHERLDRV